jgi:hypothetical protein
LFINHDFVYEYIDDGLVIAKKTTNEVYFLNRSAALIWLALGDHGGTIARLKKSISAYWPNAQNSQLEKYLIDLLLKWQDLDWIEYDHQAASYVRKISEITSHSQPEWDIVNGENLHDKELLWKKYISISSIVLKVEIWGNDALKTSGKVRMLSRFLNGLPSTKTSKPHSTLSILFQDRGVCLKHDGRSSNFPFLAAASPVFNLTAIQVCYPKARNHTVLHAAAISRSEGSIILPGEGGAGKSTLTAYLIARGWHYCGDDIVGLGRTATKSRIELLPFPTSLCIKEGSVSVLSDQYPEIASCEQLNYGGRNLRYIPIDRLRLAPEIDNWRTPRAIVFPRYSANSNFSIERLSQWDGMSLLLKAGTGVGAGTDFDSFELLVDLIRSVPCYRLGYSRLENLAETFHELLRPDSINCSSTPKIGADQNSSG